MFQEFMKRLQYKVNIVPVIAKADILTVAEVSTFSFASNLQVEFYCTVELGYNELSGMLVITVIRYNRNSL